MPALADLQRQFAQAVLTGATSPALFAGRISVDEALSIHRGTVMGALVNALRLSYPTVDALVGEPFFDHACRIFAETNLPRTGSLAAYGEDFADFLADFAPAARLPYLPAIARLDRTIETVLRAPLGLRRFVLDAAVSIDMPQSLTVLRLTYPADEIRAALADDEAMAAIVNLPAERFLLVWRNGFDAAVQRVSAPAGVFLAALTDGAGTGAAFDAAIATASQGEVLGAIQADIFAAEFCKIISTVEEVSP